MQRSVFLLVLLVLFRVLARAQEHRTLYEVSLPNVSLKTDKGERIEFIKVIMRCGRFVAINSIPDDWSAVVVGPSSEVTTLTMEAGHGTAELWHSSDLNGFITVWVAARSCFDITVSLKTGYYEAPDSHERKISFKERDLIMKRIDSKAAPTSSLAAPM